MSNNVFEKVGDAVKTGVEDAAKGVEVAVEFLPKAEKVIATAIKDNPEVKSAVLELVQQAETVIGDTAADVASKGIDLTSDAKTLADAEAFFTWFKSTFIPLIEQVYSEVKADVTSAPVTA